MTTNEPIIIDGVDVSKCGCIECGTSLLKNGYYCAAMKMILGLPARACENFPFCDFKQLQRKTAECEELKRNNNDLREKLDKIEDIVIPINNELPEDNVIREIVLILNDCVGLASSRYKKLLEPFQDEYFKGLDTKQIAELAKKSIRLTTENRKLEDALDEIEEYCLKAQDPCQDDWNRETEKFAKPILDIISKAKGEENE